MASTFVRPSAFSICASMPIAPTSRPVAFSIWVSSRSRATTCSAVCTLGSMIASRLAPAPSTTCHHVGVGPLRGPVVDPHGADPCRPSRPRSAPRRCSCGRPAWPGARRRPRCRGRPGRSAAPWPCRSSWCWTPAPPGWSVGTGADGRRAAWSWPRRLPTPVRPVTGRAPVTLPTARSRPARRARYAAPSRGGRARLADVSEQNATPSAPPDQQAALLAEAANKSGLLWVDVPGDRAWPAWHVWVEGAAYVVSGPGEQTLPALPQDVVLVLRSKDTGGRLLRVAGPRRAAHAAGPAVGAGHQRARRRPGSTPRQATSSAAGPPRRPSPRWCRSCPCWRAPAGTTTRPGPPRRRPRRPRPAPGSPWHLKGRPKRRRGTR